ncbi:MAG: hypothetical protein JXB40_04385 [Candidatus Omnitrophica bacterium]|nr:hypothetical protein [Candidatus Omnitrophota bacterium]
MIKFNKKHSIFAKAICLVVAQAFIFSSVCLAVPAADNNTPADTSKKIESVLTADNIVIPKDCGIIKSRFTGKSGKLIVHIQDAHCNYEAQSNIAKIIENLVKNDSLSFVSVEGADGLIDTSWFKSFPDAEVRKEVANYFMSKGEITGPEFLSITTDYPIRLFGAETREYYIENLNAFTSSYPLKDKTEKYFNNVRDALNRLKGFIYNADLKAMDQKSAEHEAKTLQFNDYVRFLQAEAEKNKIGLRQYENLFKLVNVLIYEKKIDFNMTDKERSSLIDELSKSVTKDTLKELVNQSISFKVGKISSADYYDYVKKLALANGIDLQGGYPNLYNYIIYNSVYSKIDNEKLFRDIKALEADIKEKLFENEDQRTLEKLSRHINILLGLVNIKLMNDDFEYYKAHKDEFAPDIFTDFIKDKSAQFGLVIEMDPPADMVADNISKLEEFYAIAIKRDDALVKNTLEGMNKMRQNLAVLVTGGFHSEGIARLLEKTDISYVIVCPTITKEAPSPYIQILTNQRTSFEEILAGTPEAKHGMLAPSSISRNRSARVEDVWRKMSISIWLNKARMHADNHRIVYDREAMRDAYMAATESGDLGLQIDSEEKALRNRAFDEIYDILVPKSPVVSIIPKTEPPSEISLSRAYSSPEAFRAYVGERVKALASAVPELESKMEKYRQMAENAKKDELARDIDALIREKYNSKIAGETIGASLENISAADVVTKIPSLTEFRKSPDYAKYLQMARALKFSGQVGSVDVWGGAASRLFGEGQNVDPSLSYAAHDVYDVAIKRGMRSEEDLRKTGARLGISMATRMMAQDRIFKEKDLAAYYRDIGISKTSEEILKEARDIINIEPRIIIINDESGKSIIEEVVRNHHYGRNWLLMPFVTQRAFKGWDIHNGIPVEYEKSRPLPAGHGDATMQTVQSGQAFLVDPDGNILPLKENAVEYLNKQTHGYIKLFIESRVNDMIKLNGSPVESTGKAGINDVDMDVLALELSLMGELTDLSAGNNAVFEQVAQNPNARIKGASPVRAGGKESLIEGVAHTKHVAGIVVNDKNPFNRFFVAYKPGTFDLLRKQGLPVYFRFRDGYLYPETVTGDLTMLDGVNAGYVVEDTRMIFDYKDDKSIGNGLAAALGQDRDLIFAKYAEEVQSQRSDVKLKNIEIAPGIGEKFGTRQAVRPAGASVGAIREDGDDLTDIEHTGEGGVNAAISKLIEEGSYYVLVKAEPRDYAVDGDKYLMPGSIGGLNWIQRINVAKFIDNVADIHVLNLIVMKGLRKELEASGIASDLVFHPGLKRRTIYVDEEDLLYLLSLEKGVELLMEAVWHELAHINNPALSEQEIERISPTYNLRVALLMRKGMSKLDADFKLAIDGSETAYNAVVAMPKKELIAYFESNLENTVKNLPEDIFGFGKGYDVRGNAQPIKDGVVDLTPANMYLVGKLLGSQYAKPGDKVLLTGDIRLHTPILRYCMGLGIASVGVNVDYAPDYLTTGAHNLLATDNTGKYKFMVQVSGSHGPSQKNGFKIKADLGKGTLEPLYAEKLEDLYKHKHMMTLGVEVGEIKEVSGLERDVIDTLNETLPATLKNEIVVIDPRAGAAGLIISAILKNRGFEIVDMDEVKESGLVAMINNMWEKGQHRIAVLLNRKPDGTMSRGIWDPSLPEALEPSQRIVNLLNSNTAPGMPKAIGAVFDGDADRISAILEDGRVIPAFEMTLPYYQRFLLDKANQEAIMAIAKAGGEPIKIVCDVRANSKLLSLVDRINEELRNKAGIKDRNVIEGVFITTGYPPQLGFMQNRIAELDKFVNTTPALKNDAIFMENFSHLKSTYFTAEASGHNFFHISKTYPSRVCDCAISGFFTLVNIRETMGQFEAPALNLPKKDNYELTELFDSFPVAYSSREITVSVPNNIKIQTAKKIGAWMKERFAAELKPYNEPVKEDDYLVQPKNDGYVTVSGFKVQLKDGKTALVRWSNTSEKLTTIFEGKNFRDLIDIIKAVTARMREEKAVNVAPLDKEIARLEKEAGSEVKEEDGLPDAVAGPSPARMPTGIAAEEAAALEARYDITGERRSLNNTLLNIGVNTSRQKRRVLIAYDTRVDGKMDTSDVARACEEVIQAKLSDEVLVVRGTGAELLTRIEATKALKGGRMDATVTIAGDATLDSIGQSNFKALGRVINVSNPENRYVPVVGLFDLALRMAFDLGDDRILDILNRIAIKDPGNPSPFTLEDIKKGIIRIMPKIRPIDLADDARAYRAAQLALKSL